MYQLISILFEASVGMTCLLEDNNLSPLKCVRDLRKPAVYENDIRKFR